MTTIADLLREALAEEDYTVPDGTGIGPFDRRGLVCIADGIHVPPLFIDAADDHLDVWQAPSGRVAGIRYRVDAHGFVVPDSAEVVAVKATYSVEEG